MPGKGLGVIATRPICKGELVLAESPLMRITMSHYLAEDVEAVFETLGEEQKVAYMSLASAHGQDPSLYPSATSPSVTNKRERRRIQEQHEARTNDVRTVFSIFITNAMQVEEGAGIFELASRFNHDCVPNACFSWDEGRQLETVHAVKDITEGEASCPIPFIGDVFRIDAAQEITLCYCDPYFDISMRRWELKHYGFQCRCKACINPDDPKSFAFASRERRWKLRELDIELRVAAKDTDRLRIRIETVATMREEGLCCPMMAHMYLEIARGFERGGDVEKAVKAATKALETYTICLGIANEKTQDAAKSVRAFEKQRVGGALKT